MHTLIAAEALSTNQCTPMRRSSDDEDDELLLLYDVTRSFEEEQDDIPLFSVAAALAIIVGMGSMRVARKRRSPNIVCHHRERFATIFHDYFAENPVYSAASFSHHFRMDRDLFLKVHDGVFGYDDSFSSKPDVAGRLGISSLQKCTIVMHMLAYGMAADEVDEYMRVSEGSLIWYTKKFCKAVVVFGAEYFWSPNEQVMERLLASNA